MIGFPKILRQRLERGETMHQYMATIMERVLTHDLPNLAANRPKLLYHYSTLETIQKILEFDNIRLSHAEYSNDRHELVDAIKLVTAILASQAQSSASGMGSFCGQVEHAFRAGLADLDAYIFCMCAGLGGTNPQDMLSQWRAYAQDGRGGAITLDVAGLTSITYHLPGLRINPVIYDPATKTALVNAILAEGFSRHKHAGHAAVSETVEALVFCAPLMKHAGFLEEKEWRLIYVPRVGQALPVINFHPRRDFLAPYIDLKNLWTSTALASVQGQHSPPLNVPKPTGNPLIPIAEVMVGPSAHQDLNVKSMKKVTSRFRVGVTVGSSQIPYRSFG
jgi:hypothetical protein